MGFFPIMMPDAFPEVNRDNECREIGTDQGWCLTQWIHWRNNQKCHDRRLQFKLKCSKQAGLPGISNPPWLSYFDKRIVCYS